MKLVLAALCTFMAFDTPSGRPPLGPLERYEPRIYDFRINVALSTWQQVDPFQRRRYNLQDSPIVMPVIFQSSYSRVDGDSLYGKLWLGGKPDPNVANRTRLDPGKPHHTHLAVMTVPKFNGYHVRWEFGYRVQVWSSRINDAAAAQITWPREWPEEVHDGLQAQMFIESNHPVFAEKVQQVSEGNLRTVPPYLAAKDLVRWCINNIRVTGNGERRGNGEVLQGMVVNGALATAQNRQGLGSPHDLLCVCIAMLRAAGIPARPVIGVEEDARGRHRFRSWGEFYLPDAGWIPFDPYAMRGKGIRNKNVRQPWPEFGTLKDLNRRIPLSYYFVPPAGVESPMAPAVWGWDPRPGGDPSSEQAIIFGTTSRGRGVEEPG